MTNVLIAGLATATILTVVETFIFHLGKWRGLLAFILTLLACLNLGTKLSYLFVYSLAATFVGLTFSTLVELMFSNDMSPRQTRGLPNRVPPL